MKALKTCIVKLPYVHFNEFFAGVNRPFDLDGPKFNSADVPGRICSGSAGLMVFSPFEPWRSLTSLSWELRSLLPRVFT